MNLFLQTTFYKQNESNIILKSLNNTFIEGGFSMNLFHLRYFETLARTEHYSKAAEILSITQPSLSYAISTLESELGIQLFEKRGRNIVLTKYGKAFYSNVKEILGISYDVPVICVPSHDTAAAVLAIPAEEEEFLFVSTGTWALIGMELEEPIVNEEVRKRCLTNEIGAFDKITLLRNSAGMFIIQRIKEEYEGEHGAIGWEELNSLGDCHEGVAPLFPVYDSRFFNPVHMSDEI